MNAEVGESARLQYIRSSFLKQSEWGKELTVRLDSIHDKYKPDMKSVFLEWFINSNYVKKEFTDIAKEEKRNKFNDSEIKEFISKSADKEDILFLRSIILYTEENNNVLGELIEYIGEEGVIYNPLMDKLISNNFLSIFYYEISGGYEDDLDTKKAIRRRQKKIIKDIINKKNIFDKPSILDTIWEIEDNKKHYLFEGGNKNTGFNLWSHLFLKDWRGQEDMACQAAFVCSVVYQSLYVNYKDDYLNANKEDNKSRKWDEDKENYFYMPSRMLLAPAQFHSAYHVAKDDENFKYLLNILEDKCINFFHDFIGSHIPSFEEKYSQMGWFLKSKEGIRGGSRGEEYKIIKTNDGEESIMEYSTKEIPRVFSKYVGEDIGTADYGGDKDRYKEYNKKVNLSKLEDLNKKYIDDAKKESANNKGLILSESYLSMTRDKDKRIISSRGDHRIKGLSKTVQDKLLYEQSWSPTGYKYVQNLGHVSYFLKDDMYDGTYEKLLIELYNELKKAEKYCLEVLNQLGDIFIKENYKEYINEESLEKYSFTDIEDKSYIEENKKRKNIQDILVNSKRIQELLFSGSYTALELINVFLNIPGKNKGFLEPISEMVLKKIEDFKKSLDKVEFNIKEEFKDEIEAATTREKKQEILINKINNYLKFLSEKYIYAIPPNIDKSKNDITDGIASYFEPNKSGQKIGGNILLLFLSETNLNLREYICKIIKMHHGLDFDSTNTYLKSRNGYNYFLRINKYYSFLSFGNFLQIPRSTRLIINYKDYYKIIFSINEKESIRIRNNKAKTKKEKFDKKNVFNIKLEEYTKQYRDYYKSYKSFINDTKEEKFKRVSFLISELDNTYSNFRTINTKKAEVYAYFNNKYYERLLHDAKLEDRYHLRQLGLHKLSLMVNEDNKKLEKFVINPLNMYKPKYKNIIDKVFGDLDNSNFDLLKGFDVVKDEYSRYASDLSEKQKNILTYKIAYLKNQQNEINSFIREFELSNSKIKDNIQIYHNKNMGFLQIIKELSNEIQSFASGNPNLTIIIDVFRDIGAMQDEFNDPRYSEKLRGSRLSLTGVPVGRTITNRETDIYIGIKIV